MFHCVCFKCVFKVVIAILAGPVVGQGEMERDGAWSPGPPHTHWSVPIRCSQVACTLAGGPTLWTRGSGALVLTAGGGGDGTVQVRQVTGGRVHAHGHGEAEDELRGGGGRGLAPLPQGPRRAGRLGGAGRRRRRRRRGEHLRLELQQLAHEAEVGRDDAAPLLDELERLLQPHALLHHQVGQADGGRPRDAGLAVNQHPPSAVLHGVCGRKVRRD